MMHVDRPYLGLGRLGSSVPITKHEQYDIAALRVGLLNLMPDKAQNEFVWLNAFSEAQGDPHMIFMRLDGQLPQAETYREYVKANYRVCSVETLADIDLLVVTGAPVGHLDDPFGDFRYWSELVSIFDAAKILSIPILGSCWGGNALLHHRYGVKTKKFGEKHLGLFRQANFDTQGAFTFSRHLPAVMAVTRRLNIPVTGTDAFPNVRVLWGSPETGVFLAVDLETRDLFVLNHVEYDYQQLIGEYERDIGNGLSLVEGDISVHSPEAKRFADQWQIAARNIVCDWLDWLEQPDPIIVSEAAVLLP